MKTRQPPPSRSPQARPRSSGAPPGLNPNRPFGPEPPADSAPLVREIGAAAEYLRRCRHELAALGANELAKDRIPAASRELDDIIEDGGEFSSAIMTATERVMNAPELDPEAYRALVRETVTGIIVQCAFQDITAQRAKRIRGILDTIERRLARLATFVAIHDMPDIADFSAEALPLDVPQAGPAPRGQGNGQAEIDRILAAPAND
jgi:chemotaxis protein CheZ